MEAANLSRGPAAPSPDRLDPPEAPSMDQWLKEAKASPNADRVGMYLVHNGVVRATARSLVREGKANTLPVRGMRFSYDAQRVALAVSEAERLEGVYVVRVWLNRGSLRVGDDLMKILIGADIRPHAVHALETLVGRIKKECVSEEELT